MLGEEILGLDGVFMDLVEDILMAQLDVDRWLSMYEHA